MGIIAVWGCLWVLLFLVSIHHHPSLALDGIATSIMVLASCGAQSCWRGWGPRGGVAAHIAVAPCCIFAGGVLAAFGITLVYDALVGPDPARFSLLTNIELDSVIVGFNFVVVSFAASASARITTSAT